MEYTKVPQSLEDQLQIITKGFTQYQQVYQNYKNSPQNLKKVRANEVEQAQQNIEEAFRTYGEIERFTPNKQVETKLKFKKLNEQFLALKNEFSNSKRIQSHQSNFENDLQKRAQGVNNGYIAQTDELKEINRKVEEATLGIQLNNEDIIDQDLHLAVVDSNLGHVQSKAEIAGKLVNDMQQEEGKKNKITKYVFFGLVGIDVILAIIIGVVLGTKKPKPV